MRLYSATISANTMLRAGVHLIEVEAPHLAQVARPGQYCMLRCCDARASDPLLRRPFFIHSLLPARSGCAFLVYVHGRGSAWLARQPVGAQLDLLGPLGRGWNLRPTVSALLLVSEGELIAPLPFLAQQADERGLSVTLLSAFASANELYPPALLPPEVEYQALTTESAAVELANILDDYLNWADAAYLAVSRETSALLYRRFERLRKKHFAQGSLLQPLLCGSGVCQLCMFSAASGAKLICKDGPIFDLREIAR